ncbi:MAG: helix-turn-helix domain-containing protein [Betaproteobacteria bacterium]
MSSKPPAKPLPADALEALRRLCTTTSQAAVSRRLGVTPGSISQALNGRYVGNVERLAERIRGEVLGQQVACPLWGQLTLRMCQDKRETPLNAGNPLMVRQWQACRGCIHNPKAEQEEA